MYNIETYARDAQQIIEITRSMYVQNIFIIHYTLYYINISYIILVLICEIQKIFYCFH